MNSKKWIIVWIFIPLSLTLLILEVSYSVKKNNHRHNVDYIVNEQLENLRNEKYTTIILGDSLAVNSFTSLSMHDLILNLSSNAAISLAGNYFILKKYLSSNQMPKNVYLFLVPEILTNDLNNQHAHSYYQTVFIEEEQIEEMNKIDSSIFKNKKNKIDKYIESRKNSFINFNKYSLPIRHKNKDINEQDLKKDKDFRFSYIQNRIKKADKNLNQSIKLIPQVYLDKIISLCKFNNIKCTIAIEPLPQNLNRVFLDSKVYKHIKNLEINILNINDYFTFKNEYFYDGVHIRGDINSYYQNLIDKHILDIY